MTRDLGPQTEREVERQLENEVEAERLTRLDRTLIERAKDGRIDLHMNMSTTDFGRAHHQLLIARARQLERMGLAEQNGALRWSLSPETESVLRRMGERRYLVLDGIDGRSHYVAISEAEGRFPIGSVLRVANAAIEPRPVDRTVAEIAAAHDGRYSVALHRFHDTTATESFAQTHVRRLEAIRRATGSVERAQDGPWIIKDLAAKTHRGLRGRVEKGKAGGGAESSKATHVNGKPAAKRMQS